MFGNPSYPTYQAFLGLGIAAAIALLLMPWWIKLLKVEGIGQQVRADGPKRHLVKQGTPTMGGVVILVAISLTCLLMGKLTTELVLVLLATLATGVLGLIDDLTSVTHGRSLGLTPHAKMIGLTIICVTFTVLAVNWCGVAPEIRFPGGLTIDLGVLSTTICGKTVGLAISEDYTIKAMVGATTLATSDVMKQWRAAHDNAVLQVKEFKYIYPPLTQVYLDNVFFYSDDIFGGN